MRYLIFLAVMTLAGCGQKGALYLPKDPAKETPVVSATKSTPAKSTTQGQP